MNIKLRFQPNFYVFLQLKPLISVRNSINIVNAFETSYKLTVNLKYSLFLLSGYRQIMSDLACIFNLLTSNQNTSRFISDT